MHDPQTVAHEIKYPWKNKRASKLFPNGYRDTFITIWHVDPEKPGPWRCDDSCGWFMRSGHGDAEVLEKIVKRFEFDWDRVFKSDSGTVYFSGLFCPNGDPHFSVSAITLNLFFIAIGIVLESDGQTNWNKARKWMQSHLFELVHFAENPTDSLHDCITRKYEIGCGEPHDERRRKERIQNAAQLIYGYILRDLRPWYKHPRWHIHHWKIQVHPWQTFRRWILSRCCKCGGRFKWGESCVTHQWDAPKPKFLRGETHIMHDRCSGATVAQELKECTSPSPK